MKTIYLKGDVGYEITADDVRRQLGKDSTEKVQVIINSYGGSVFEAFEIYNLFKSYKGKVEFIIAGIAASAASYITMSGDKISAFKNSTFMAHKSWSIGIGDSDELEKEARLLKAIDNVQAEAYSVRLGKTKDETLQDLKNEIWLVGWEELSNAGVIDDVIDKSEELELNLDKEDIEEIKDIEKIKEPAENVKLKIISLQARIRKDEERLKTSAEKAAAFLKEFNLEAPDENKKLLQEGNMSLQEILEKNPEAKAEFENALAAAKAEGVQEMSGSAETDKKRIAKILKIADAKLSPEALEAIEGDTDPADFAIKQIEAEKARQAASNAKPTVFGDLVTKQTPQAQTLNAQANEGKLSADEFEEKLRAKLKEGGK